MSESRSRGGWTGIPRTGETFRKCGHIASPENTYVSPDGYPNCRTCRTAATKRFVKLNPEKRAAVVTAWRAKNPDYRHNERGERWNREGRWRQQGVRNLDGSVFRQADFDRMRLEQDDRCLNCGITTAELEEKYTRHARLAPDHDHETGLIRGLVCVRCNTLDLLAKAVSDGTG